MVTQTLIYFIATGFMRLSILAFLPRLNKDRMLILILAPLHAP